MFIFSFSQFSQSYCESLCVWVSEILIVFSFFGDGMGGIFSFLSLQHAFP